MKWIDVQNNQSFDLESIVYLRKDDFSNTVSELLQTGSRMIALTPIDKNNPQKNKSNPTLLTFYPPSLLGYVNMLTMTSFGG